jgi:hypothetical protein
VVREHLHVDERAVPVERDEQVRRRPREAGDRREVDRLEQVTDEVGREARWPALPEQRPDRDVLLALADDERLREVLGERGAREDAGARGDRGRAEQRGARQQGEERPSTARGRDQGTLGQGEPDPVAAPARGSRGGR